MKTSAALLIASLALSGAVLANPSRASANVKNEAAAVPRPAASSPSAAKAAALGVRGTVSVSSGKEGAKDPYAVPLFKDARQLR